MAQQATTATRPGRAAAIAALVTAASVLAACGEPAVPVQIGFDVAYGGAELSCDSTAEIQLTDLRFYVHDVRLRDAAGSLHTVTLDADGAWQQADLAMLDLENGAGGCANGTAPVRRQLQGMVAAGDYRGIEFVLGVPFDRNHANPLLARPPLDDAAMHWHWRGGYKFLRAGVRTGDDNFWLHLGSTGCEGSIQDITGCSAPNRVTVSLDDYVPGQHRIVIDLAEIVAATELADGVPGDCSSGPAEEGCAAAFAALGLEHATGRKAGMQRLFSSRRSR